MQENEDGLVLVLTLPLSEMDGRTLDEIIAYLQAKVADTKEELFSAIMAHYLENTALESSVSN